MNDLSRLITSCSLLAVGMTASLTAAAGVGIGFGVDVPLVGESVYGPGKYEVAAEDYGVAPPSEPYAPRAAPSAPPVWYYCNPARAYYPYVRSCPVPWQVVAARPTPQAAPRVATAPAPESGGRETKNLGDILFDSGKTDLLPASTYALDRLIEYAEKEPNRRISVEGYTDNRGDLERNHDLAQRRAEVVALYLEDHGIERSRIDVASHGEAEPAAQGQSEQDRQLDRRVDVTLR